MSIQELVNKIAEVARKSMDEEDMEDTDYFANVLHTIKVISGVCPIR